MKKEYTYMPHESLDNWATPLDPPRINPEPTLDQRIADLEKKVEQILQRLNSIIE